MRGRSGCCVRVCGCEGRVDGGRSVGVGGSVGGGSGGGEVDLVAKDLILEDVVVIGMQEVNVVVVDAVVFFFLQGGENSLMQ